MTKKVLSIFLCLLITSFAFANDNFRTITGIVISADDDEPLIGATITAQVKDKNSANSDLNNLGTITDIYGKFSISVSSDVDKLVCSYIGYTEQSVKLQPGKNDYKIILASASQALGEVVVTGYQTLEKRRLTAAISKVEMSDAILGASKSIDQALSGQIAGVSVTNTNGAPGAPAKIRIRGTASLNGTQDPLWVLDGIPLEGTDIPKIDSNNDNDITNISQSSIAGLSPNDIENITILKDAAATAIYGARAANGVIVITSKRGKTGKINVNFNSKLTYSPNLDTDRLNLLNAEDKINLELELLREPDNWMFGAAYPVKGGVATILNRYNQLYNYKDYGWDGISTEAQDAINRLKGINTNWNDILFRDAFTQEYNLSLSGGSEKVTYYNSLGYTKENGNVPGVDMERYNLTSKTSYQVNKILKLGVSVFANRRKNNSFVSDTYGYSNPIYYSRIANPYYNPYDENGRYVYDYDMASGNEQDLKRGFNIFEERANTDNVTTTTSLNSIFNIDLRFNDNWKVSSQVGIQLDDSKQEQYVGKDTYSMRDIRENSRYYDSASKTYKYVVPEGGKHRVATSNTSQITWKSIAEYKNTFADIHDMHIMVGSEIRKNWYESESSTGYGYDPRTLTTKPLIFRDEEQAKAYPLHSKSYIVNAFSSFFANGSYTFHDKYTVGGSIRFDGSDMFGVDKKYRYLPIYSVSALWRASNESFMEDITWLNNLALRTSYGIQGNIDKNTSPFLVGKYNNISLLPGSSENNIVISSAPNDKLRWEKTTSYNLGLDFALFNQAVNFNVDYYYRKGTDLIGTKSLPLENGFSSMSINWASMENEGIEVDLRTRNIATKDFSWYTTFNFAYNKNKVLKNMTPETQTTPGLEGYPVGAIFALKSKVDPETGRILIADKNNEYKTVEEVYKMMDETGLGFYSYDLSPSEERNLYRYAGTSDAPYTGGFINTFNYKNWELNVNFSYHAGGKVRTSPSYNVVGFDTGRNTNADILDRWSEDNKGGKFPLLLTRNNYQADYSLFSDRADVYRALDLWVKDLNYVRLQNIRLAYNIPSNMLSKIRINNATVAFEARNLFVFGSSYKNYMDPESMGNLYSTPIPKSFTFNLNLNF